MIEMEIVGQHIPETTLIIRIIIAALFGGLIGLEREYHGQPAGLRTHIII